MKTLTWSAHRSLLKHIRYEHAGQFRKTNTNSWAIDDDIT